VIALASYDVIDEEWVSAPPPSNVWFDEDEPRILNFPRRAFSSPLTDLFNEIDRSREILTWEDDWDDEGSPRFEESTWKKAIDYLERHARLLLSHGFVIPTPRILPGPNGSIDLHWETGRRELLINVRPDGELAGFYGEAAGTNSIKGKVDLNSSDLGIFKWLTVTD
jgi:hypothetical protein